MNKEQDQQSEAGRPERFESDTHKLMRKHMSDPNHQITDEELAKVRVGMSPGADEPTQQAVEEADQRIADSKTESEDDTLPGAQKMTPWDVTT
jgi:hypothetical protein